MLGLSLSQRDISKTTSREALLLLVVFGFLRAMLINQLRIEWTLNPQRRGATALWRPKVIWSSFMPRHCRQLCHLPAQKCSHRSTRSTSATRLAYRVRLPLGQPLYSRKSFTVQTPEFQDRAGAVPQTPASQPTPVLDPAVGMAEALRRTLPSGFVIKTG